CTAFKGNLRIAAGNILEVAKRAKAVIDGDERASVLIFDDSTNEPIELDFRGTMEDVLKRLEEPTSTGVFAAVSDSTRNSQRGPGRPKLGVISREVTLLPRHWDWLGSQPGGASVALRKLVEEARRVNGKRDKVRRSQEVTYKFMSAMCGNLTGFEEAARALFAADPERFDDLIALWPVDLRDHTRKLAGAAFQHRARE
ncbi:MAG: DUF2239 family protein, partial [Desulfobacterales bacterium]|nr:DUF2239 family protein [Desulfobacterales bacterium]